MEPETDFKKIGVHLLLIIMAVSGLWGFLAGLDWVMAPSRRASMTPVTAQVLDKWAKKKGGGKGTSYTLHVLELQSNETCPCTGSAQVDSYTYDHTATGDSTPALCYKGTCYSPKDRRWDAGYRFQLWLYLLTAILFAGIEAVKVVRYLKAKR
ncbi:MAG: hypothetical protein AB1921_05000 [Thermodesulfobacteriota bacterium]